MNIINTLDTDYNAEYVLGIIKFNVLFLFGLCINLVKSRKRGIALAEV